MTPSKMGAPPGGTPERPVTERHDAPPEGLALLIWRWYGEEEYHRLILLGELGPALQFLAMDAEGQRANIGCCADCNLWSYYLEYLDAFVKGFPPRLLPQAHAHLQALLTACETLCHDAYVSLDGNNFEHPQWTPLRTAAQEALALLGWREFEEHMPALVEDCSAALKKWPT